MKYIYLHCLGDKAACDMFSCYFLTITAYHGTFQVRELKE